MKLTDVEMDSFAQRVQMALRRAEIEDELRPGQLTIGREFWTQVDATIVLELIAERRGLDDQLLQAQADSDLYNEQLAESSREVLALRAELAELTKDQEVPF